MKSEEALTERIQIRVSEKEYEAFKGIADRTHRSVSEVVRWAATGFLIVTSLNIGEVVKSLGDLTENKSLIDVLKPISDLDPDIQDLDQQDDA